MSWGHTDRLLWQHFSLSCDPRSGLSSLHRWTHLDGLLMYLCLPDIVLSSRSMGVTPGVQSCKTLTRGFASLILRKRMICVHAPFCPVVCITETTPFVLSWKVTGLKRGTHGRFFQEEGRIFYKITLCHFNGGILLSVSFLSPDISSKVMCENPPQEVPFGDLERSLPLLQRTCHRSPCGGCSAIICGFTQSVQIL